MNAVIEGTDFSVAARAPLRLQVVVCSTRPGRIGEAVARWFATAASRRGIFEVEVVDLKSFDLPVFDEPKHPRLGEYAHEHTRIWSAKVQEGDAFVFVMPEYNHLPPAAFINAVTYLSQEWSRKAAAFVSYGGVSGGVRAVQVAKPLLAALRMVPSLETIVIANVATRLDGKGRFVATPAMEDAVAPLLHELHRVAHSLWPLRP